MVNRDQMNWLLEANDPDTHVSSDGYVKAVQVHAREDYGSDLTPEQIKEAQEQWESVVLIDFEEWNSGFAPDSEHKITVYLDYGMGRTKDREAVRKALLKSLELN